jgi:hypothetical protein
MSSGVPYPPPTYLPPLPIFNPLFFPQSFDTTTTSGGGGGGFTNIFPMGLTSGNVITMDGGTGGGGGGGLERTITGISYLDFVDSASSNPTAITGYITLNGNTLEIGSNTASSGINVNLLGSVVSANGVAIATGGNVSNDISNNFLVGTTQTFQGAISVDNTQSNIGQLPLGNNTAIGLATLGDITIGNDNSAFGYTSLQALTTGSNNTSLGYASLSNSLTDDNNTAVGYWSGQQLNGGSNNTYLGYESGYNQLTGSGNVAVGFQTGVDSTAQTLSNTIAIGNGITSVATGDMIFGFTNYTGSNPYYAKFTPNTSFQGITLEGIYNGSQNFTINAPASSINLEGTFINLNGAGSGLAYGVNVFNGMNINGGTLNTSDKATQPPLQALYCSYYSYNGLPFYAFSDSGGTTTHQQLATSQSIGQISPNNTGIGFEVLDALTSGDFNSAFGYQALNTLTTGTYNSGIGFQSLASITTGEFNIGVGAISLPLSLLDNNNTAIGYASGFNLNGNGTNSNGNTFLGYRAGFYQTSGSNNVAIGLSAGVDSSTPTLDNTIAIGNITATAPLDIIIGSSNQNYIKFYNNTDHYELTSTYDTTGTIITDLYVNGFAQQPSTSTPTYLPNDYGTFYNSGGLPYFAYNNAGTISSQQLATSTGNQVVSLTSSVGIAGGSGTLFQVSCPFAQNVSLYPTAPYGTSFTYSISTNISSSTYTYTSGGLAVQGLFTHTKGTGVYQPFTQSGITYWGYVLSTAINRIGALTDLDFLYNLPVAGNNNFYFTTSSTDPSLLSTTITLVIRPNP